MLRPYSLPSIDYLAVGHLTKDLQPGEPVLGGSVAYAALTARALGLRPGILSAWAEDLPLEALEGIPLVNAGAIESTTFENVYTSQGRQQQLHQLGPQLDFHMIPEGWRSTPIVHLAPVAGEVSPQMLPYLDSRLVAATPQGWLRQWNEDGLISPGEWLEAEHVLSQVDAAVISLEDVDGESSRIELMAAACPILVVTEADHGAKLYQYGEVLAVPAPQVEEVDPTGAGDIFATAFFARLHFGDDARAAVQFAVQAAAYSVARRGLDGIPTADELYEVMAGAR